MTDFPDFDPDSDEVISREVIEHDEAATERSQARRIALQALYEIDSADHAAGVVLSHLLIEYQVPRQVRNYVFRLVHGIMEHLEALDRVLQRYAPEFPILQVAIVDRNIMRLALYEIGIETRTPVSVAIDEAIELAKLYGAEGTTRFVNGVLGTIALNLDAVRADLEAAIGVDEDAPADVPPQDEDPPDV